MYNLLCYKVKDRWLGFYSILKIQIKVQIYTMHLINEAIDKQLMFDTF